MQSESEESKKAKQKPVEDTESQQKKKIPVKKKTLLERWQESLTQCTSASRLFVHLGTLKRSVAWSCSVPKAHCRICRRRGDAVNMLLCDECNRGHHLYCLKPLLKTIPEGDWFCLSCKPIEKPESDSDIESSENESEESEEEEMDEEEEEDVDSSIIKLVPSAVQESCKACGGDGILLCCDHCPFMYHQECVNIEHIPCGEWLCPKCRENQEAIKKAQDHRTKRKYEDSFEDEFSAPPSKRPNRERKSNATDSEKEDNPFKKVY